MQRIKNWLREWVQEKEVNRFQSLAAIQADRAIQDNINDLVREARINKLYMDELRSYLSKLVCAYQCFPSKAIPGFDKKDGLIQLAFKRARSALSLIKDRPLLPEIEAAKAIKPAYISALIVASTAMQLCELLSVTATVNQNKELHFITLDFLEWDFKQAPALDIAVSQRSVCYSLNLPTVMQLLSKDLKQLIFSNEIVAHDFVTSLTKLKRTDGDPFYRWIEHAIVKADSEIQLTVAPTISASEYVEIQLPSRPDNFSIPYNAQDFLTWLQEEINHSRLLINEENGLIHDVETSWFLIMPAIADLWHKKHSSGDLTPDDLVNLLQKADLLSLSDNCSLKEYQYVDSKESVSGVLLKKDVLTIEQSYPHEVLLQQL